MKAVSKDKKTEASKRSVPSRKKSTGAAAVQSKKTRDSTTDSKNTKKTQDKKSKVDYNMKDDDLMGESIKHKILVAKPSVKKEVTSKKIVKSVGEKQLKASSKLESSKILIGHHTSKKTSKVISHSKTKSSPKEETASLSSKRHYSQKELINNNSAVNQAVAMRPTTSTVRKNEESNFGRKSDAINDNLSPEKGNAKSKEKDDVSEVLEKKSDEEENSYEEDFEDDFEEDTETDNENMSGQSANYSDTNSDSNTSDNDSSFEENVQNASGIIMQPTIVRRQAAAYHSSNDRKVKTKFLRMSNRSSTFVKTLPESSKIEKVRPPSTFINFATTVKRHDKMQRMANLRRRGKDLLDLITLDEISYEVFEIPPMNYDVYIKQFGKATTKQVGIQTEFVEDDETQTDDIDFHEKWTQNPPCGSCGVGGDCISTVESNDKNLNFMYKAEGTKLCKFLQNITPIILNILQQAPCQAKSDLYSNTESDMPFSCGYYNLEPIALCKGSPVTYICHSSKPTSHFLTIYGNIQTLHVSPIFSSKKGVICIWDNCDPMKPEYALLSNSQPTCACFGPYGYDTIIAGMVDGSVMLWDLKEPIHMHETYTMNIVMRSPTYNTAGAFKESHQSCVVSIQAFEYSKSKIGQEMKTGSGKSYHVFTLEEIGILNIWVVVEVPSTDLLGLNSDLGLAPGGKIKLIWSSSVSLENINKMGQPEIIGLRTFDFQIFPKDGNHIILTTDTEIVYHITRNDRVPMPKFYTRKSGKAFEIRCVCFSPHDSDLFLVGCSDGSAMLFNTNKTSPLLTVSETVQTEPITCINWSPSAPAMFFTLNSSSYLHIYDLMENKCIPKFSYMFSTISVTWFSVYKLDMKKSKYDSGISLQLMIGKEDGEIQVHALHSDLVCQSENYVKQIDYMKNL